MSLSNMEGVERSGFIGFFELDEAYVEYEVFPNGDIDLFNIQLPHPKYPKRQEKWCDITDYVSDYQKQKMIDQIREGLQEAS